MIGAVFHRSMSNVERVETFLALASPYISWHFCASGRVFRIYSEKKCGTIGTWLCEPHFAASDPEKEPCHAERLHSPGLA